jgi:hypothetical protein
VQWRSRLYGFSALYTTRFYCKSNGDNENVKIIVNFKLGKRDVNCSVSIALVYELEDRDSRVRFPAGAGNLSLHLRVQNGSGAHTASYQIGTRALSLGVKRPGREADHSPPPSTEVKE